jgi:hypothetical protein
MAEIIARNDNELTIQGAGHHKTDRQFTGDGKYDIG